MAALKAGLAELVAGESIARPFVAAPTETNSEGDKFAGLKHLAILVLTQAWLPIVAAERRRGDDPSE